VPSLGQGETYADAAQALRALGLSPQRENVNSVTVPSGQVVQTVPGAGASVARGATVAVQVSDGPQLVTVPNVSSESVAEATAVLGQEGLTVSGVSGPADGVVTSTKPGAGAEVQAGSSVSLSTGSRSPAPVTTVPPTTTPPAAHGRSAQ
jgi:serine/threonine-protein kinase